MDKKRIFIAIPASEGFKRQVMEFSHKNVLLPVRWLQPWNLHITLVPPFEVDEKAIKKLVSQLESVADFEAFRVQFEEVSFGPDNDQPRLIWAKGKAPAELYQFKGGIEKTIDYTPDRTDFLMHVTLARFPVKNFDQQWENQLQHEIHWTMLVNKFVIMEAVQLPDGADYPILYTFGEKEKLASI